jgi:hypothetical protein
MNYRGFRNFISSAVIIFLITFSQSCFSMLCPSNYNSIELGYTMEQIISLCGAPNRTSQYSETISVSGGVGSIQSTGFYSANSNNFSSQGVSGSQQVNDVKEKVIVHTKFLYTNLQAAELDFDDGILVNRTVLNK